MIKLKPIEFDGSVIEDESFNFKSQNSPFYKILLDTLTKVEQLECFTKPIFQDVLGKKEQLKASMSDHEVEVVFFDNPDILDWSDAGDHYNTNDGFLGFHAINSGIYESEDSDFLSKKHRVFIYMNEDVWLKKFLDERLKELDPSNNRHDGINLIGMMNTLTHELMHAQEFITNGCGLTPSEAQDLYEIDEIDYSVNQLSTGHGILYPESELENEKDIIDRMEDRVEEAGDELLRSISINKKLFNECLDLIDGHISKSLSTNPQANFRKRKIG